MSTISARKTSLAGNPVYRKRVWVNRIGLLLSMLAMAVGMAFLLWILWTIAYNGFGAISTSLFTQMTPSPDSQGGLLNAIAGSLMMVGMATLIGTPVGILAGIYLGEFGQ
ncbi:MAG: phosphate ABC transporter permease PtsA, partial [Burkholderiales bacterium]